MNNFFRAGKIKYCVLLFTILLLVGCGQQEVDQESIGSLLYIDGNQGLITREYTFTGNGASDRIQEVITKLSENNEKAGLTGPLTLGTSVVSSRIEGQQANISLDANYYRLSNIQKTQVVTALVKSITSINGIESVRFFIGDSPLVDMEGRAYPVLTGDMFVTDSDINDISDTQITVAVYFADKTGNGLVKTNYQISYAAGNMEHDILQLLINGPIKEDLYPTINPATKINSITIKDGQCDIDFSGDFLNQTCNVSSDVAMYSVINTLCSLDNINRIRISVDGNSDLVYQDKFDLKQLYEKKQELVIK